jgi:hypothetical protein
MKIKTISAIILAVDARCLRSGQAGENRVRGSFRRSGGASRGSGIRFDRRDRCPRRPDGNARSRGRERGGLAPGRTAFQAYGDILAEAPITPGARVAFKFHKVGDAWELTELKAR